MLKLFASGAKLQRKSGKTKRKQQKLECPPQAVLHFRQSCCMSRHTENGEKADLYRKCTHVKQ